MELDVNRIKTEEDVTKGVAIGKSDHPFYWKPIVDPELILRTYMSYRPFLRDDYDWLSFGRMLTNAVVFTRDDGWLAFDSPGLTVQLHGAAWDESKTHTVRDQGARDALDTAMNELGVQAIVSYIPEHAKGAHLWSKAMGFVYTGIVPLAGTWDGKPRNLRIYSLFRKDQS